MNRYQLKQEVPLKEAVEKLKEELRADADYFYGWQSNIAMAFKDEYHRVASERTVQNFDIHEIANKAAVRFLNNLTNQ